MKEWTSLQFNGMELSEEELQKLTGGIMPGGCVIPAPDDMILIGTKKLPIDLIKPPMIQYYGIKLSDWV